jgi:hypothetical protein
VYVVRVFISKNIAFSLIYILFLIQGCSGSGNGTPVSPQSPADLSEPAIAQNQTRSILAAGKLVFDFSALTVEFIPSRTLDIHFNVTPFLSPPICGDCVVMTLLEFNPTSKLVRLDIAITNPTTLTVYDVRGIALTNDPDVRLLNADAYTNLWDDGGAVTRNPFIAYYTNGSDRQFGPLGTNTREFDFTYVQPSGLLSAYLVVDVSFPGHAGEAYDITDQHASGILTTDPASMVTISCAVHDWQNDISGVQLQPFSLGYTTALWMGKTGSTYSVDLTNEYSAPPGRYRLWIKTHDQVVPALLYDDLYVDVTTGPPPDFYLKPGECFADATWSEGEYSEYVTEYHLYKREMGNDYDYQNPIVIPAGQTEYIDEDVLAGHMYFYKLAAEYSGAESEYSQEEGAKPFKWGDTVLVSDADTIAFFGELAHGYDDSLWVAWYGGTENLDDLITPDWDVYYYALMPGSIHAPKIAVDAEGYVHLVGMDSQYSQKIRYIKCHPYYGGVQNDVYVIEGVDADSTQMAMDPSGTIHVIYLAKPPGAGSFQVYYLTIDPSGYISEPEMISSGWNGSWIYSTGRLGLHYGASGTLHAVWIADDGGGPQSGWHYRSRSNGEWGEEEFIVNPGGYGTKSERTLWEDPFGVIHFSDTGSYYYYRDTDGWHGPFDIAQNVPPDAIMDYGGGVTGDPIGNVMFVYCWGVHGEVTYRQQYRFNWSDEYSITTGHNQTGYETSDATVITDKDGLAVVVWSDSYPNGNFVLYMRRQIME